MASDKLKKIVQEIVSEAKELNAKHTDEANAPVNYACIFTQSDAEFDELVDAVKKLGKVVKDTAMGPVFHIEPIETEAGMLHLLKIRKPDLKRTEKGDADFTVSNYEEFKKEHLGKEGWGLIERPEFEMLELIDSSFNVLAYYSHPTLTEVLKIIKDLGMEEK